MSDEYGQTLVAFVLDSGKQSRRLLKRIQEIDEVDPNVKIVDAAIVDRTRFRVKVHQTEDLGGAKGAVRGAGLGVIVGALVLGPAGAVVGGAAGGVLNGLRNRFHDIGIDDKFMRQVTKEIERGKSAIFILYEGNWAASIGMIEQAITVEKALLISSTLPPKTAAALKALVDPAVEQLGGAEVVSDYEVEAPEAPAAEEAPVVAAAAAAAAVEAAPAEAPAASPDDLTQLAGVGPKASAALATAGIATYAALAEANEPQVRHALHAADMVPPANVASWPMQASFAAKGDWQGLMKYNQRASGGSAKKAAKATKSKPAEAAPPDDLTQLTGIGPRISTILADAGVTTYAQLEHTDPSDLRKVIAQSGALPPSSLDSWPTQASYAARGDWQGLSAYNHNK
jgi:predicted flap endonuclease-1-like 5' DNA nuclease